MRKTLMLLLSCLAVFASEECEKGWWGNTTQEALFAHAKGPWTEELRDSGFFVYDHDFDNSFEVLVDSSLAYGTEEVLDCPQGTGKLMLTGHDSVEGSVDFVDTFTSDEGTEEVTSVKGAHLHAQNDRISIVWASCDTDETGKLRRVWLHVVNVFTDVDGQSHIWRGAVLVGGRGPKKLRGENDYKGYTKWRKGFESEGADNGVAYDANVSEWDGTALPDFLDGYFPIGGGAAEVNGNFAVLDTPDFQLGLRCSNQLSIGEELANAGKVYEAGTGTTGLGLATWNYDFHIEFKGSLTLADFDSLELVTNIPGHGGDIKADLPGHVWLFQGRQNLMSPNSGLDPDAEADYQVELTLSRGGETWTVCVEVQVRNP